ncbi:hypothetical protein COOONC_17017 [Cooperia oncophora]
MGNPPPFIGGACNLFCRQGLKCALVQPENCNGCTPRAQCVQQECNTICVLPCPAFYGCVLVNTASGCCPIATCRPPSSLPPPYTTTPRYTPPYTTQPPYTTRPPYTTQPPYTTRPPYTTTPRYRPGR